MLIDEEGISRGTSRKVNFCFELIPSKLINSADIDSKRKHFTGILLHIKGTATVRWTEQHTRHVNGRSQTHTITYYGTEEYMEMKYYCIGGRERKDLSLNFDS